MFSSINKTVAAAKFLVAATETLFFFPNFVAVTKPFFFSVVSNPENNKDPWRSDPQNAKLSL